MSKIGFAPFGDRVIVSPDPLPSELETDAGLILTGVDKNVEQTTGTVVAVGDAIGVPLEVGDRVIYSPYAGFGLTINRTKYMLLTSFEILGKRTDEDARIEVSNG